MWIKFATLMIKESAIWKFSVDQWEDKKCIRMYQENERDIIVYIGEKEKCYDILSTFGNEISSCLKNNLSVCYLTDKELLI
jgi:hypothetical protein